MNCYLLESCIASIMLSRRLRRRFAESALGNMAITTSVFKLASITTSHHALIDCTNASSTVIASAGLCPFIDSVSADLASFVPSALPPCPTATTPQCINPLIAQQRQELLWPQETRWAWPLLGKGQNSWKGYVRAEETRLRRSPLRSQTRPTLQRRRDRSRNLAWRTRIPQCLHRQPATCQSLQIELLDRPEENRPD